MVIKETRSDKIFNFINYFLLACVFLICLYPLWFIIIASISNPDLVNGGQVWFWPKDISFDGYKSLFADDGVMRNAKGEPFEFEYLETQGGSQFPDTETAVLEKAKQLLG